MAFPQCGSIAVGPQVLATLLQLIYRWDFWNVHPSSSSGVRELPMHGLSTHLCFPFKMMWTDAKKSGFTFGSQHHHSCCSWYSSHRNFIRVRKRKITLFHMLSIKWLTYITIWEQLFTWNCGTLLQISRELPFFKREKKERRNDICLLSLGYACTQQVHFVSLSCEWQTSVECSYVF